MMKYRVVARNDRTDSIAKYLKISTMTASPPMQIAPSKGGVNETVNNHDNDGDVEGVGGAKEDRGEGADQALH